MKSLLPIIFATIAAIGNAMFALGQKKSSGVENHHNNDNCWNLLVEGAG